MKKCKYLSLLFVLPLVLTPTLFSYSHKTDIATSIKLNKDISNSQKSTIQSKLNNGMWPESVVGTQPTSIEQVKAMPIDQIIQFDTFDGRALNIVTPVRNQSQSQICWAYSLAAVSSTNILYQPTVFTGDAYKQDYLNISPRNIDHTVNIRQGSYDPLKLTEQDTVRKDLNGNTPIYNFKAPQMFYQGRAPIQRSSETDPTINGNRIAMLKDVITIPNNSNGPSNVTEIKKAIAQYGAVSINYYSSGQKVYYPRNPSQNHASAIVGWMDGIQKEHFKDKNGNAHIPSRNGAWIVKNSWGPTAQDEGYFYLSYDSPIDSPTALNYGPADLDSNIYYYDGKGEVTVDPKIGNRRNNSVAAIFPVLKATDKKNEVLKSINIAAGGKADMQVKVSIYGGVAADLNNPKSKNNNPEAGVLLYQQTDQLLPYASSGKYEITHTIELTQKVTLSPNTNYSVVVEFVNKDGNEFYFSEEQSTNDMTYLKDGDDWISLNTLETSGDHPVATIHAITVLEDKPVNDDKDMSAAQITITESSVVYVESKQYQIHITDVQINGTSVNQSNYSITTNPIIEPSGNNAGTLLVSIVGKNGYYGYTTKQIPITKAPFKTIPSGNGISFDSATNKINIEAQATFSKPINLLKDISLPPNWSFINPDAHVSDSAQVQYTGSDKDCYAQNIFDVLINVSKTKTNINDAQIEILNTSEIKYTGEKIIPNFIIKFEGAYLTTDNYKVLAVENNINAGNANIKIEGINFFEGIINQSFVINKADNQLYEFFVENGKIVFNCQFNADKVQYKYFKEYECINQIQKPTEPGNYFVKAYVAGNDNINNLETEAREYKISNDSNSTKPENPNNKPNDEDNSNNMPLIIALSTAIPLCLIIISLVIVFVKKKK